MVVFRAFIMCQLHTYNGTIFCCILHTYFMHNTSSPKQLHHFWKQKFLLKWGLIMEEHLKKRTYFELIGLHTFLLYVSFYLLPIIPTEWWDVTKCLGILQLRGVHFFSFLSSAWQKLLPSLLQLSGRRERNNANALRHLYTDGYPKNSILIFYYF